MQVVVSKGLEGGRGKMQSDSIKVFSPFLQNSGVGHGKRYLGQPMFIIGLSKGKSKTNPEYTDMSKKSTDRLREPAL